jgi:hypothetical protein
MTQDQSDIDARAIANIRRNFNLTFGEDLTISDRQIMRMLSSESYRNSQHMMDSFRQAQVNFLLRQDLASPTSEDLSAPSAPSASPDRLAGVHVNPQRQLDPSDPCNPSIQLLAFTYTFAALLPIAAEISQYHIDDMAQTLSAHGVHKDDVEVFVLTLSAISGISTPEESPSEK